MNPMENTGALKDLLVVDLSRLFPGPYASMILADHGARVIQLEDRRFAGEALDDLRGLFRNKEHVSLNLKTDRGKTVFFQLAEKADVILEGFRPGVVKRLGIDYDTVRAVNPRIIYCSITGYGQTGPLAARPGHDINYLAESGVLSLIGEKNGPPVIPGIQIADTTGGLNAAVGILIALFRRGITGFGEYIDISMTDAVTALLPYAAGRFFTSGTPPEKGDDLLSHRFACYNIYETKDGKHLAVGALEHRFWRVLCDTLGVPEYIHSQYDETHRREIIQRFREIFGGKPLLEWTKLLAAAEVCAGPVKTVDEALTGPLARMREMVLSPEGASLLGVPIRFLNAPGRVRTPPPTFGEHTRSVLTELGYSETKIKEMEAEGVV